MITKNYIKMCEQAEDLQKGWKPKYNDSYYYKIIEHIFIIGEHSSISAIGEDINEYIYIPSLEQLFNMVGNYKAQISRIFLSIMIMKKYKFDSMQELVINAVMEIKYHKIWTGKKWELIE